MNGTIDESNARGHALERQFAEWMKRRLRYSHVTMRWQVKGRVAVRPYEVDIKAKKFDPFWESVRLAGIFLLSVALLSSVLPQLRSLRYEIERLVGSVVPSLAPYALGILGFVAFVLGMHGRDRSVTHAWVECKNTQGPVKRDHVMKLAACVQDVRRETAAKWQPEAVFFVAGEAGFDQDALNFTREHGFITYQQDGGDFKLVA